MAVRYQTDPPGPTFIPSMDEILGDARHHPGASTLQRGDMIELIGSSGSGKTLVVLFLLLVHLLPSSLTVPLPPPGAATLDVPLGGKGSHAALLYPITHRAPLPLLYRAMKGHLISCLQASLAENFRPQNVSPVMLRKVEDTIQASLSRLKIARVKPRWGGWLKALRAMRQPLDVHLDPNTGGNVKLELVLCDGFGDGFWVERWSEEEKAMHRRKPDGPRSGNDVGMPEVMAEMERLRSQLGAIVVVSTQGLFQGTGAPLFTSHLPPPYPAPFTSPLPDDRSDLYSRPGTLAAASWPLNVQITCLGRTRALQYPVDLTLIDTFRTKKVATPVNSLEPGQKFEALIRVPGSTGLSGTTAGVRGEFRVGEEGIEVWAEA